MINNETLQEDVTEREVQIMAEKAWKENDLIGLYFVTFDNYLSAVKEEVAKYNAMTLEERKQLQETILTKLGEIIRELENKFYRQDWALFNKR